LPDGIGVIDMVDPITDEDYVNGTLNISHPLNETFIVENATTGQELFEETGPASNIT